MKSVLPQSLTGFLLLFSVFLSAQSTEYWSFPESKINFTQEQSLLSELPAEFKQVELNVAGLYQFLADASKKEGDKAFLVSLPTPEGDFAEFMLVPTLVVADEVAHLYSVQTFKGYAPGSPQVRIRCDVSSSGFHAVVFIKGNQTYVIEPQSKSSPDTHLVYYKSELPKADFPCEVKNHGQLDEYKVTDPSLLKTPTQKRTYRLALIADPNYQTAYGGMPYNVQNILNSFAAGVNLINEVYERDMGVSYELVSNEACAEASGISFTTTTQVHNFIVAELGVDGFDIGHSMVWSNTGGAAFLGVVCNNASKGRGFSGNNSSFVTLYIDYGAHEIGHQMGADHTFVAQECSVTPINYRFEPGQGSTIMAYAGLCGAGYQNFSDPYLHSATIAQMHVYMAGTGSTCGQTDNTGNANAPSANAQNNITIPRETPFVLVGTGTDADGDPISFDWQQFDGSGSLQTGPPNCNSTDQPLFRIRLPQEHNFRVLPEMSLVLAGNNNGATFEKLPCVARTMNFRMQVRDNNPAWGRTAFDDVVVTVANTGPFNVTAPNGGELWDTDLPQTVTWTVNGTDAHCSEVDILLTTDNGDTYTSLGTYANNGSASVNFPLVYTTNARLLIQCSVGGDFRSASTFFDLSDATFSLTATDCNGNEIEPVTLAGWTFETSVPTTAGPHTPEAGLNSASSEASASHVSGSVTYSNPAGNGSTESFNSNNWTAGDYYQVKVPTTGYEQISISWDQTRSGTGPESFQLQWSTDGANFTSVLDYSISEITWSSTNYNANSTFAANLPANTANEAMVWVRLVSLVTTASGGTNRVDNIVLTGLSNAVPGNPCDDGIPCTINDTWDNDCNCIGILQDTDGDGICDGEDTCPNVPNSEIRGIVVDGNITDFGPAIANGANSVNYYFSADDDYFYVGVTGVDHNDDNIHIAFSTNDGSTTAANWGVNWDNAPYSFLISIFGSDNICYYPFNDPYGCQQVGTSWANYAGFAGNPTTELRIPRSFLGSLGSGSGAVNLSIWTNNNAGNFVWSTYPTNNPTGSANVNWVEFGQQAYPTYLPQDPAAEDECGECILNGESNPLWNVSCADCEGVANGTALPGTACDDGDPSTGNDTYDANCICVGMLIDCEGVPGGLVLPGTSCDDGDPNTENDQYNNDCECVGTPIGGVTLSGVILWEHDDSGVPLADVDLMQGLNLEDNTQTSATGAYSFSVAPDNSTYDVVPSKTPVPNAPNCGVTVLDVQLIQQHVTFVNVITDPYKLIAADVNRDDKISTLDALLVAQTLLGNPVAAAIYNKYWRFVDVNYNFPVPASPWGFPELVQVPNVTNDVMDLNFYGIIIGDVNGSGSSENSCSNPRNAEALVWTVEDQPLTHYGQEIELAFYPEQFQSLSSYQFGLGFSTSHLQLLDIQPGAALPLTAGHFGAHLADAGELRTIWWDETDKATGISLRADEPVFNLRFRVLRQASSLSNHLWIDEQVMPGFAYHSDQLAGTVSLKFDQAPISNTAEPIRGTFQLYQNVPNPFNKKTRIGFYLPEACQARLRVYDVTGQLLHSEEANYSVGFHEIVYQKPDNASGILYYQLQTPFGTAVKKMIGL